jgi:microcompartment protein CcmK/EutM
MRIARVIGTVTLSRKLPELKPGRYVLAETLDDKAIRKLFVGATRAMMKLVLVLSEKAAGVLLSKM